MNVQIRDTPDHLTNVPPELPLYLRDETNLFSRTRDRGQVDMAANSLPGKRVGIVREGILRFTSSLYRVAILGNCVRTRQQATSQLVRHNEISRLFVIFYSQACQWPIVYRQIAAAIVISLSNYRSVGFRSIAWNEALGRSAVTLTDKIWTRLLPFAENFFPPLDYFSSLQTCRFEVGVNGIPRFSRRFFQSDVLIERSWPIADSFYCRNKTFLKLLRRKR